jgi:hypothetical protein
MCARCSARTVADMRSSAHRLFKASFGNDLVDDGGGRFTLFSGEMHAHFNRARTVVTGTWRLRDTERDAMGNATDQCDSGAVRFTAQR